MQLNSTQQEAVRHTDGPILILAGAGSGKTRVLTHKAVYLIKEKGVDPNHILMVTFTNKAANEMKERIRQLLTIHTSTPSISLRSSNLPYAGTFHSLSAKILRRDGHHIGIAPHFVIYDELDQKEAIRDIMTKLDISAKRVSPVSMRSMISQAKNELLNAHQYLSLAHGFYQEMAAKIYLEYERLLNENSALDFDDLLLKCVQLLLDNKEVRNRYQEQFRYVLVDEYQDTNHAQYKLSQLLSGKYKNICAVGDASQSIYAWRGANFRNISGFQKDFPNTRVFHLERNYRSTQVILDAAYGVISQNTSHPILKLWTKEKAGPAIELFSGRNEHEEAAFIISQIEKLHLPLSEIAVLYRINAQSRLIEEALLHSGIPYVLVGGVRFYERKEIKDVLAYLRLILNPKDILSRKRIEKIGKTRAARFFAQKDSFSPTDTTLELLDRTLEASGYLDLYDRENEEDLVRLENIKELRSVASEFPELPLFLENVALVESEYYPDKEPVNGSRKDAVTLMTIHSAKGLEFTAVFIIGMEEGLFPHSRTLLDPAEIEEERRLCYVGITRAKKYLYLTHANRRLYFGTRMSNTISRFVADIPENLLTSATFSADSLLGIRGWD